tara:strand:- start:182 stop:739 length:558 start_codon:yes stop_codon:yes gene_type:complete
MPGTNSIDEFKSNFHGGTRRNRFEISGSIGEAAASLSTFHAYAFNLPAVGIGEIPVDYRGRRVYIPGDRDYPQWTLTILDDAGGPGSEIYPAFQEWQRKINDHTDNVSETGPAADRQQWTIKHLEAQGQGSNALKTFILKGCWPVSVGPISLAAGARDELVTFDVTVRYDYLNYESGTSSAPTIG